MPCWCFFATLKRGNIGIKGCLGLVGCKMVPFSRWSREAQNKNHNFSVISFGPTRARCFVGGCSPLPLIAIGVCQNAGTPKRLAFLLVLSQNPRPSCPSGRGLAAGMARLQNHTHVLRSPPALTFSRHKKKADPGFSKAPDRATVFNSQATFGRPPPDDWKPKPIRVTSDSVLGILRVELHGAWRSKAPHPMIMPSFGLTGSSPMICPFERGFCGEVGGNSSSLLLVRLAHVQEPD